MCSLEALIYKLCGFQYPATGSGFPMESAEHYDEKVSRPALSLSDGERAIEDTFLY